MAKTLIIYYSKYGTTKKYAEWIASELNGDICAISDFKKDTQGKSTQGKYTLDNYDVIVIGSALYAGRIQGMDIINKNYEILRGKKIVLFTCGLADYSKSENINEIAGRIAAVIPENIRQDIKIFYLRGGVNYKEMGFIHKKMMDMMRMLEERKLKKEGDNASEETREFLATYGQTLDFMDKSSIIGILEYCRG